MRLAEVLRNGKGFTSICVVFFYVRFGVCEACVQCCGCLANVLFVTGRAADEVSLICSGDAW